MVSQKKKNTGKTKGAPVPESKDSFKSFREGVESIVIAIVLAFLFRAFEAEAFVIPTGSMAPTLQGRHKDITCDQCGYRYRVGDSLEYHDGRPIATRVHNTVCPMCSFDQKIYDNPKDSSEFKKAHVSHTGDRILVNKFAYEKPFGDPKRWDVIVFKYPNNAKQNYIKRLIGLPNETLKIFHGDVYTIANDGTEQILRKPPNKLVHMLQLVHDTNYIPEFYPWKKPWEPVQSGSPWKTTDRGKSYSCNATDSLNWIQFQQRYISAEMWKNVKSKRTEAKPILVSDSYAYNGKRWKEQRVGMRWVGDLALECEAKVESEDGLVELLLIEAGRHHTCRINVETGQAELSIDDGRLTFDEMDGEAPEILRAQTKLKGRGNYDIRFANVDNQLTLWINNRVVDFKHPATYSVDPTIENPVGDARNPGDLAPARIGAKGVQLTVDDLRVLRDVYYVAVRNDRVDQTLSQPEYGNPPVNELHVFLSEPTLSRRIFQSRRSVQFQLGDEQFLPMGDNSPMSKDGRIWGEPHYVERDMLIGKAVFVYFPHPYRVKIPFVNRTFPIFPDFRQMRLIR